MDNLKTYRRFSLMLIVCLCSLSSQSQDEVDLDMDETSRDTLVLTDDLSQRRNVIYNDLRKVLGSNEIQYGQIVLNLCANRDGKVTFVEIDRDKSTITSVEMLNEALVAGYNYIFEPNPNAAQLDCGSISIEIKNFKEQNQSADSQLNANPSESQTSIDQLPNNGAISRKMIYSNVVCIYSQAKNQNGTICFNVCINREGKVKYASIVNEKTTLKNKRFLQKALNCIYEYQYEPDPSAAAEECGTIRMIFGGDQFENWRSKTGR